MDADNISTGGDLYEDREDRAISKKTKGDSSVPTALRFVERELMNDGDLPSDRCRHPANDLESIYGTQADLGCY